MKRILILLSLMGCAQVTSLSMQRHQFGLQPSKIIWFQVAGLDSEHLAMLRFGMNNVQEHTDIESSVCMGMAWTFNLYHLRNPAAQGMMSQLTGKKSGQGQCDDWSAKTVWNYLVPSGYRAGIVEVDPTPDESLIKSLSCEGQKNFLDEVILWSMASNAPTKASFYLPAVTHDFRQGNIYWDKSCTAQGCGSALTTSLSSIYGQFSKNSAKHFLLIKDFSFQRALLKQDFVKARDALREIDKAVGVFHDMTKEDNSVLVLVSGSRAVDIDFPQEGKEWQGFDLKGSNAQTRKSELAVPVFAHGARAENFCGFYEESQIFERLLTGPKQQGLELKIINPFN